MIASRVDLQATCSIESVHASMSCSYVKNPALPILQLSKRGSLSSSKPVSSIFDIKHGLLLLNP